jgi:hypothetical protein
VHQTIDRLHYRTVATGDEDAVVRLVGSAQAFSYRLAVFDEKVFEGIARFTDRGLDLGANVFVRASGTFIKNEEPTSSHRGATRDTASKVACYRSSKA